MTCLGPAPTTQPRTVLTRGQVASGYSSTAESSSGSQTAAPVAPTPTVIGPTTQRQTTNNPATTTQTGGSSNTGSTTVDFTPDFQGNPFLEAAYNLDLWQPLFDQHQYEKRLETEAEMMIGLEAMRFAMI